MTDLSKPLDLRVGLEVHIYIDTPRKLFCGCRNALRDSPRPNTHTCPVCTGQPGAKPRAPAAQPFVAARRLAAALDMHLTPSAEIMRKHYVYPDLPSGYQRTSTPVASGGALAGVGLRELHVEEDAGAYDAGGGTVDYDRAGAPLIELVTEPDILSSDMAKTFLDDLRYVVAALAIGVREAGFKADVNVSIHGGDRVEVKNVLSRKSVMDAIVHEAKRQAEVVARGEQIRQQTRGFDEVTRTTRVQRTKETAADYRYLPDPDLPNLDLQSLADPVDTDVLSRRQRLANAAGLTADEAGILLTTAGLSEAHDVLAARVGERVAAHFLLRDVRAELDYRDLPWEAVKLTPHDLADLVAARQDGAITPHVATRVLRAGLDGGDLAAALASERRAAGGGAQDDADALHKAAREAIAAHPEVVAKIRAGKSSAINFLVGQVMRATRGRADAESAREALETLLAAET